MYALLQRNKKWDDQKIISWRLSCKWVGRNLYKICQKIASNKNSFVNDAKDFKM